MENENNEGTSGTFFKKKSNNWVEKIVVFPEIWGVLI